MNAETATDMSKLNHAQQNAVLSRFSWTTDGKVRVLSTHRSAALLAMAGVINPTPLEYYNLPVVRDKKGFLILDLDEAGKRTPVSDSDDSLFEPGGLFAADLLPGEKQPLDPRRERLVFDGTGKVAGLVVYGDSTRVELEPELMALREIPLIRTFEIPNGPHSKVRVQVLAFVDEALPSPGEPERWVPAKTTDADVRAAVVALHLSRLLTDLEQI